MNAAGLLPGSFFRTPLHLLERLGVCFVQAPASELTVKADAQGLGDRLDLPLFMGRPRLFPGPSTFVTELRVASWMSDAVGLGDGHLVAEVSVRLASGRDLVFPLRVGHETGEWAYDRSDVRPLVRHRRPPLAASFPEPGQTFSGHRYLAMLRLPGRFRVSGVRIERRPSEGRLFVHALGLADGQSRLGTSLLSGWLSETKALREIETVPTLRLFALRGGVGAARVVDGLRLYRGEVEVRRALLEEASVDPRREALLTTAEAARGGLDLTGARAGRAEVVRSDGGRQDVRALGPGLLVLATTFDRGWRARVNGSPAPVLRVGAAQIGIPLRDGPQRIALRYGPPGLREGTLLALGTGLVFVLLLWRERRLVRV
jgi:hypothetical protein